MVRQLTAGDPLKTRSTPLPASLLIPALRGSGREVRALVHDESKAQPLREAGVEVVLGDMEQPNILGKAVKGANHFYLITTNGSTGEAPGTSSRPLNSQYSVRLSSCAVT